ncbi:MAG TPA: OmpA family protein [Ramlibacter sp.]
MKKLFGGLLLSWATVAGAVPVSAQECSAGPFMVFFEAKSVEITAESADILDNAAEAYALCSGEQVNVAGHTDRSGTDQENVDLSDKRAYEVAIYLISRGVPQEKVLLEPFGESQPLVLTEDDVAEPQNNRVEVSFGMGTGW